MQVRRQARMTHCRHSMSWILPATPLMPSSPIDSRSIRCPSDGEDFLRLLVGGVMHYRHELDALIQQRAPAWPVGQIAIVDRNLLRMALFELSGQTDTPAKVAINEAIDLAKMFGSDSSSRFVNGVLGAVMAGNKMIGLPPWATQPAPAQE